MTLPSATAQVQANGDGSTKVFSFPYLVLAESEVIVYLTALDTGVHTLQTNPTDYSVQNIGTANVQVTFVTAPTGGSAGDRVTISRNMGLTQTVDYVADANFQAETHEEALDRATMGLQELADDIKRCIRVPEGEAIAWDGSVGDITARASKLIGFDASGDVSMQTAPFTLTTDTITFEKDSLWFRFQQSDGPPRSVKLWVGESASVNMLAATWFY